MSDLAGLSEVVEEAKKVVGEGEGLYEEGWVFSSEEVAKALVEYLQKEITDVKEGGERAELEKKWNTWRRQRLCRPERESKDFPWEGASNLATPSVGANTNAIYAHVKRYLKRRKPLITVGGSGPQQEPVATALTRFLNRLLESPLHIDFVRKLNKIVYETVSMGTQFVEIPWMTKRWQFKRTGAGGNQEQVDKVVYDGPVVKTPKLEDVFTRVHWGDLQAAPWVAIRERWFRYALEQQAGIGFFRDVDKVFGTPITELPEGEVEEFKRLGLEPAVDKNEEYEIYRVYVFWDVDGNGIKEDLLVWFHLDTGTILRAEFNELGRRPIVKFPYLLISDTGESEPLYGIGVGWLGEQQQREIDTFRNMRVNSTFLASCQMLFVREGLGLGERFRIQPALVKETPEPKADINVVSFPDVTQSTLIGENVAKQDLNQYTGANDIFQGLGDSIAKTRSTASGMMFLAQRTESILASVIEDMERAIGEVGLVVLMQMVCNYERAKRFLLPEAEPSDMPLIERVLGGMRVEDIPFAFKFEVKTTEEEKSEDAKRTGIMMLTQLYSMYYKELLQLMPLLMNPQMMPEVKAFVSKYFVGRTKLMEQTLQMFGETNSSAYVPYVKDLEFQANLLDIMKESMMERMYGESMGMVQGGGLPVVPAGGVGQAAGQGAPAGFEGNPMGAGEVSPGGPGGVGGNEGLPGQGA